MSGTLSSAPPPPGTPPGRAALQAQGSACVPTTCLQACPSLNVFSFLCPHGLAHSRCLGRAPSCPVQPQCSLRSRDGVRLTPGTCKRRRKSGPGAGLCPGSQERAPRLPSCPNEAPGRWEAQVTPMATGHTRGLAPALHLRPCSPCAGRPTEEARLFSKESASELNRRAELRGNVAAFHRGGPGRVTKDHRPGRPCSSPRTQVSIPRAGAVPAARWAPRL